MRLRVLNPNHEAYGRYGGRGVSICARWENFLNFLEDMGPRPEGKTLDRHPDKDGNYEPTNCRWATPKEQQNNLSSNRLVEYAGEVFTVSDLARKLGIKYETMYSRLTKGMPLDEWRGRPR
jgi:hypothetical protein